MISILIVSLYLDFTNVLQLILGIDFLGYTNSKGSVLITCPGNNNSSQGPSLISSHGEPWVSFYVKIGNVYFLTENNNSFIVWIHGKTIDIHKEGENNTLMPCSNSLKVPATIDSVDSVSTGGVMGFDSDFSIVICGITTMKDYSCFMLDDSPDGHMSSALGSPRVAAASLTIDNGTTLWLTGGNDTAAQETSIFLKLAEDGNGFTSEEKDLSHGAIKHHCLERVDSATAILIGGQDQFGIPLDYSYLISTDTTVWNKNAGRATLKKGRARHSCGVLKDPFYPERKIAIVAGGKTTVDDFSVVILSVETLEIFGNDLPSHDWSYAESNLPMAISDAASVTSVDQQSMFVIGGIASDGSTQDSVYRLHFSRIELKGAWETIEHAFKGLNSKAGGLAMVLPPMPTLSLSCKSYT